MASFFHYRQPFYGAIPILLALGAGTCVAEALPEYKFEVGRELFYEKTATEDLLEGDEDDDQPRREIISQWRIYPVRRNDDGSWRLLLRRTYKTLLVPKPGAPINWKSLIRRTVRDRVMPDPVAPEVTFENDLLAYMDMPPDGSYAMNHTLGDNSIFKFQPEEILCQLPKDASALRKGWQYNPPASGAEFQVQTRPAVDGILQLAASRQEPEDVNYEMTVSEMFSFDSKRGVVTKIQRESKADWDVNPWHVRSTVELISQHAHEEAWTATFAEEAEDYFDADRGWWEAMEKAGASRSAADCKAVLDEMRERLVVLRDRVATPELRDLCVARLKLHDRDGGWAVEEAAEREALYAKPPVDWETTDFDDQPRKQLDYRGQVVLMDFWYRGCGHCIEALPKIKALAKRYEGRPVAVLGINNDAEDENARYVIKTFKLKYPNLRNGEISKSYGVNAWPTLIVLDQAGRVALFHTGNTDNLIEEVSRTVDELLANPATIEQVADKAAADARVGEQD